MTIHINMFYKRLIISLSSLLWIGLLFLYIAPHSHAAEIKNLPVFTLNQDIRYIPPPEKAKFEFLPILMYDTNVGFGFQGLMDGSLPVQVLLPLGGVNTLRGYPQDRFLGKVNALFNAEVRFPLFWRFGGVVGLDTGKVWDSFEDFKINLRGWAADLNVGLRFYMDTFIVRVDVGFSKETMGFFFNFGHLF